MLEANLVANLEANDNSKGVVAKAEMPSQKRLMPLSIMVCDTISAVRSGTLLKVLLDSRYSHAHTLQKPASSQQTIPSYQNRQC